MFTPEVSSATASVGAEQPSPRIPVKTCVRTSVRTPRTDMCKDMCMGMRADLHVEMGMDKCVNTSNYMHEDMRVDIWREYAPACAST